MASNTLQEFLVQLSFNVNDTQLKRFSSALVSVSKTVVGISLALEGATVALTAFTTKIASQLESLFYSSARAGTTIANLQSLQFALGQTGQGADSAAAMLEQFRMSMRLNPAIEGFLQGLGVMTRGVDGHLRDTNAIFEDFITKMRAQPFPIAAQMAEFLGISPQQLLMLESGQDARLKAERDYLEKQRTLGFNSDKFGKTSVDFMNSLRDLGSTVEIIFEKIGVTLIPVMTNGIKELNSLILDNHASIEKFVEGITGVIQAVRTEIDEDIKFFKSLEDAIERAINKFKEWKQWFGDLNNKTPTGALVPRDPKNPGDLGRIPLGLQNRVDQLGDLANAVAEGMKKAFEWLKSQGGLSPTGYQTFAPEQRQAILAALHLGGGGGGGVIPTSFNTGGTASSVSDDLLNRVRQTESGGNNNEVSRTGAQGPYQFMPGAWARFGQGSPFDPAAARTAATKYLNYLLQMFNGNIAKALAGYNWGEGNVVKDVAKWGDAWLQHAPGETQNYVGKILGNGYLGQGGGGQQSAPSVHIEQHNTIHAPDPSTAGQEVAVRTRSIWSDVIRVMRQPGVYA